MMAYDTENDPVQHSSSSPTQRSPSPAVDDSVEPVVTLKTWLVSSVWHLIVV